MYDKDQIADMIKGLTGDDLIKKIFEISNDSWVDGYNSGRAEPD